MPKPNIVDALIHVAIRRGFGSISNFLAATAVMNAVPAQIAPRILEVITVSGTAAAEAIVKPAKVIPPLAPTAFRNILAF